MTPSERPPEDLRLSDLLGCVVVWDGEPVGAVTDVRLAQVGSPRGVNAEFLVESLLVSTRRAGALLGYDRQRAQGPLLLRFVVRRLHRHAFLVDWTDVTGWDPNQRRVTLASGARRRPAEGH